MIINPDTLTGIHIKTEYAPVYTTYNDDTIRL